jgi:hypothetical protein
MPLDVENTSVMGRVVSIPSIQLLSPSARPFVGMRCASARHFQIVVVAGLAILPKVGAKAASLCCKRETASQSVKRSSLQTLATVPVSVTQRR